MSVQLNAHNAQLVDSRLGGLLLESRVISAEQLDEGLVKNESTGVPIGSVLLVQAAISHEVLESALLSQTELRQGAVTRNEAVANIAAVAASVATSTARSGDLLRYDDFLRICKAITPAQLAAMKAKGLLEEEQLASGIVKEGLVSQVIAELSRRCFALVRRRALSVDKAVFAFQFCQRDINQRRAPLSDSAEKLAFQFGLWTLYDNIID